MLTSGQLTACQGHVTSACRDISLIKDPCVVYYCSVLHNTPQSDFLKSFMR